MILENTYIIPATKPVNKPLAEIMQEICETDPKPICCELPNDLRFKSVSSSGTSQMYTYVTTTSSVMVGTSTSTTTTL
jgi:hypothetical protein